MLLLAGAARAQPDAAPWERPRLVVIVSVDQFRADYVTRLHGFLPEGGLRRLLAEGAWFTDAHFDHGSTFTGPGHATIATGSYGHATGVVANKYLDIARGQLVGPAEDPATHLVGVPGKVPGFSPAQLVGSTIGDELRLATGMAAKVVALTLKPRASVMLAGRLGRAFWFDRDSGRFVTSTWYGKKLPAWVEAFNRSGAVDADFGKVWKPRGPKAAYALATADDAPWEAVYWGLDRAFPHELVGEKRKRDGTYYRAWAASPQGIKATFTLTRAALAAEELGVDDVPDLLAIGISSTDYIGHKHGPYSHEIISEVFDVDDFVRDLLGLLDTRVGKGRYVLALTADHGAPAVPEHLSTLGVDAGRLKREPIAKAADTALDEAFGAEDWVLGAAMPFVTLNPKALAGRSHEERARIERLAGDAVARLDGVQAVYTRTEILAGRMPRTPISRSITRAFHPERAGDLYVLPRPNWFWDYPGYTGGCRHGSPYTYDTHVPLVLHGAGIRKGVYRQGVELTSLAPTLAQLLAVTRPSLSTARVLVEALLDPVRR